MKDTSHISIIIVSYNVEQLLLQCLRSVYANNNNSLSPEIIVVDNNSSDDSINAVRKEFPEVVLIENKFNVGFSAANNQGIKIAKGNHLFLLNPDTEIIGNAIEKLENYMEGHPDCSIVVPQLLNSDKTIQTSVWENHHPLDLVSETFYFHKVINRLNYSNEQLTSSFEIKTVSGAALFFRKELIQKIGMLDEHLFWMEDIDFSKRAQDHGKLIYLNTAQVVHHSGQSQKKNYNVAIANQLLSKLKYYRKHHSVVGFAISSFSCFIFIISRLVVFGLLSPFKQIYNAKAKAYFYSLMRYFKYLFLNDKKLV